MPSVGQVLGVVGHPAKTLVVELRPQRDHVFVGRRRVSYEEEDRCDQRSDLGAELADSADHGSGIGFGGLQCVGATTGIGRAIARKPTLVDGADEAGLAAEGLVDRVDRHPCVGGDGRDGGRCEAISQEPGAGSGEDVVASLPSLLATARRVVAARS